MASPTNKYQEMARDAADRIERAHDLGQQLTFLGDEAGAPVVATADRGAKGRPAGARNKGSSQLREWLAAQGYRLPEDQLAQMAGLANGTDAMVAAMEQAERVLTWAYDGKAENPTPAQRLALFASLYTIMLRAADALMPYGAAKASPDVTQNVQVTQVVMPAAQAAQSGPDPRVIEGSARPSSGPPPLPEINQQKQHVTKSSAKHSDDESRMK